MPDGCAAHGCRPPTGGSRTWLPIGRRRIVPTVGGWLGSGRRGGGSGRRGGCRGSGGRRRDGRDLLLRLLDIVGQLARVDDVALHLDASDGDEEAPAEPALLAVGLALEAVLALGLHAQLQHDEGNRQERREQHEADEQRLQTSEDEEGDEQDGRGLAVLRVERPHGSAEQDDEEDLELVVEQELRRRGTDEEPASDDRQRELDALDLAVMPDEDQDRRGDAGLDGLVDVVGQRVGACRDEDRDNEGQDVLPGAGHAWPPCALVRADGMVNWLSPVFPN